jgi:hypothetical protein
MRAKKFFRMTNGQDAFTDLLFNALLGFTSMFTLAFLLISEPSKAGKVDNKAEYLITIRWPDNHPDDVDTIVEDPRGKLLWFQNRDTGLMHLDRDDRGLMGDRVNIDGVEIANPINQETASVRSLLTGEYVVNILHYKANYAEPLSVAVKVEKLNPEVQLIYYGQHELNGTGDERTAVRFTLNANGESTGINSLQKSLLTQLAKKAAE